MQQSEQINELAEALAKAQGQMPLAKKDSVNPHFKSNYADLAAIVTAVKKALSENSISYMQPTQVDETGNVTVVTMLAHKSGQWVKSFYPVKSVQNNPQGLGSALTFARRYSLAAIAGVAAEDEDDDGNAASVGHNSPAARHNSASSQNASPRPVFANQADRQTFIDNVTRSFAAAETLAKVKELSGLNQPKVDELWASGDPEDKATVDTLVQLHKDAVTRLKNSVLNPDGIAPSNSTQTNGEEA